MGFSVALIFVDDGLYFPLFSARVSFTGGSFLCFSDNRIYLLFHLVLPHKGSIGGVVGLVWPFLGLDEAALDDLPYHHFKGAGRGCSYRASRKPGSMANTIIRGRRTASHPAPGKK